MKAIIEKIQKQVDGSPQRSPFASEEEQNSNLCLEAIIRNETSALPPNKKTRIEQEFFSWGPLHSLLEDENITEIIVQGRESIWFEKNGRLEKLNDSFLSELTFKNWTQRLLEEAQMSCTINRPFADGHWNSYRIHFVGPPAGGNAPLISLRRHPSSPWTFEKLEDVQWAETSALSLLEELVKEHNNLLIVGPTSSGKTSVLNACLQLASSKERCVLLEENRELCLPNEISCRLVTRQDTQGRLPEITLQDLVKQSLRMRPDRLVVGEIRNTEAKDLLLALATGHKGSLATLHASSAHQALVRLEMLIQLGAPQWSTQAIRQLVQLSADVIVVVARSPRRHLQGVYRLESVGPTGYILDPLYETPTSRPAGQQAPKKRKNVSFLS